MNFVSIVVFLPFSSVNGYDTKKKKKNQNEIDLLLIGQKKDKKRKASNLYWKISRNQAWHSAWLCKFIYINVNKN